MRAARTPKASLVLPAGLQYRAHFVEVAEAGELAAQVATLDFAPFQFQQWQGNRRVAWFGHRYDYGVHGLIDAPALPAFLEPLRGRAAAWLGLQPEALAQVLVTEYRPGAGIGWHRDRSQFGRIVGVSLLAPCTLRLRRRTDTGFERASLHLEDGSAYALDGAARSDWEHSIAPLRELRYSITLRTLR